MIKVKEMRNNHKVNENQTGTKNDLKRTSDKIEEHDHNTK